MRQAYSTLYSLYSVTDYPIMLLMDNCSVSTVLVALVVVATGVCVDRGDIL